jgi:hypothetical protein
VGQSGEGFRRVGETIRDKISEFRASTLLMSLFVLGSQKRRARKRVEQPNDAVATRTNASSPKCRCPEPPSGSLNIWGDDESRPPLSAWRHAAPDDDDSDAPSTSPLRLRGSTRPAATAAAMSSTGIAALEAAAIAIDETPVSAAGSRLRSRRLALPAGDKESKTDMSVHGVPSGASVSSLRRPGPPKLLCCEALAAALARHPHLTLAAHNRSPGLNAHKLDLVIFRISSAPTVPGALLDPVMVTVPFSMARSVPAYLEPVIGTRDVYNYLRGDLTYLRESGGSPTAVRVPLALPGLDDGVADRPMLFIPDSVAGAAYGQEGSISVGGGGWVISERRWEGRLHGGARHWRRE